MKTAAALSVVASSLGSTCFVLCVLILALVALFFMYATHRGGLRAFERAAFALDAGALSPIVETASGFHVILRV